MTLVLSPDTEERLRSVAHLRGQAPEAALATLLDQALTAAEAEAETIRAELQASEDDFNASRSMTLEEWRARMDAKIEAKRRAVITAWPETDRDDLVWYLEAEGLWERSPTAEEAGAATRAA